MPPAAATHTLESTYYAPYVTNAPMEPRAAVALWENERLTVWAGTQRPFGVRAELAADSAIFVAQLKKGEEAENAGDVGYGLACYLNAQRLYPASEIARAAVDRLSAQVLHKAVPATTAAAAANPAESD